MSCRTCQGLNLDLSIRSPAELSNAIRIVRANLADHTLREVEGGALAIGTSFAALAEEGPWPDYVRCRFRCHTCGLEFALEVECYHGSGGRWGPVRNG